MFEAATSDKFLQDRSVGNEFFARTIHKEGEEFQQAVGLFIIGAIFAHSF